MTKQIVASIAALSLLVGLSGCMMMGMHGGMMSGSHKSAKGGQTTEASPALVKESIVGNVKVIVEYPPARVGAITTYTVSVLDASTNQPRSGATISATIRAASEGHQGDVHEMHGEKHDSAIPVTESTQTGVYAFQHRYTNPGPNEIHVTISALGSEKLDPSIVVSAVRDVRADHSSHSPPQADVDYTLYIVGAVAMAVMMVFVMGRVF